MSPTEAPHEEARPLEARRHSATASKEISEALIYTKEGRLTKLYSLANAPAGTEPGVNEPGAAEPGMNEAGAAEPGANEAGANELGAAEPGANELGVNEMGVDS
jgi:hypothetical protein